MDDMEPAAAGGAPEPGHGSPRSLPVAEVLSDLASGARPPRPGWARIGALARAAVAGLVDPGALTAQNTERRLVAAACAAQSRSRVVAVLSAKGGTGSTTTAAGVALTLAALRADATVLIDATAGAGTSLGVRLLGRAVPSLAELGPGPSGSTPPSTPAGLGLVDGSPWPEPGHDEETLDALHRLADGHAFTILDIGTGAPAADAALVNADQAVVVIDDDHRSVESARVALERIAYHIAEHVAETVFVVVRRTRAGVRHQLVRTLRREIGADAAARVVVVPYDRALAGSSRIDPAALRPATRRAYLSIAAHLAGSDETSSW
ncbi:hypothetical protein ACN27F_23290 [Solwaraspora sp. WMMB335]|uniref:hypothetical protein n=1 Tax=Solwaraspora sp. WMMB335 TaxID=3404118 RepID=UPI003B9353A1